MAHPICGLRLENYVCSNTSVADKQVSRISSLLDLQEPIVVGAPEDLLPVWFESVHILRLVVNRMGKQAFKVCLIGAEHTDLPH